MFMSCHVRGNMLYVVLYYATLFYMVPLSTILTWVGSWELRGAVGICLDKQQEEEEEEEEQEEGEQTTFESQAYIYI